MNVGFAGWQMGKIGFQAEGVTSAKATRPRERTRPSEALMQGPHAQTLGSRTVRVLRPSCRNGWEQKHAGSWGLP